MTVALITVSTLAAGLAALVTWLVYGRIQAADQLTQERAARIDAVDESRVTHFELDQTRRALTIAEKRAALAEEYANASRPNADLAAGDITTRVRRAAQQARAAVSGEGDQARGDDAGVVRATGAAGEPDAADVPAALIERLL